MPSNSVEWILDEDRFQSRSGGSTQQHNSSRRPTLGHPQRPSNKHRAEDLNNSGSPSLEPGSKVTPGTGATTSLSRDGRGDAAGVAGESWAKVRSGAGDVAVGDEGDARAREAEAGEVDVVDVWDSSHNDRQALSGEWTGTTYFQKLPPPAPPGHAWCAGRLTKIQASERTPDIWPETWSLMTPKEKREAKARLQDLWRAPLSREHP